MLPYKRNAEIMPGAELPAGISRYALAVEYDGAGYHGWQRLTGRNEPTVQAAVERALSFVANEPIQITCAGRTDAGVHATNQIVHFDTTAVRDEKAWMLGGNSHLPAGIRIKWASPVIPQFHARFSARARTYRYLIANTPAPPAISSNQCLWIRKPLDVAAMQQAAAYLVGEHDFTSVRGAHCQAKSPVRTLYSVNLHDVNGWVVTELHGNAFLHHMVRNIMGLLVPVGMGVKPAEWVAEVLAAKNRSLAGKTEKAGALYLVRVGYDRDYGFPLHAKGPFMLPDSFASQS